MSKKKKRKKKGGRGHDNNNLCPECNKILRKCTVFGQNGWACLSEKGCGRWWTDTAWETDKKFKAKVNKVENKMTMFQQESKKPSVRSLDGKKKEKKGKKDKGGFSQSLSDKIASVIKSIVGKK